MKRAYRHYQPDLSKDSRDPFWNYRAHVFNAITHHPDTTGLFSDRQKLADRVARKVERMIHRNERRLARRRWWWNINHRHKN